MGVIEGSFKFKLSGKCQILRALQERLALLMQPRREKKNSFCDFHQIERLRERVCDTQDRDDGMMLS